MSDLRAGRFAAALVAAAALLGPLAAMPAASAPLGNTATAKGSVTPGSGGPSTAFTVTYTTPIATGIKGKSVVFEEVQVSNTNSATFDKPGCSSSLNIDPAYGAAAGSQSRVTLRPAKHWCAGSYHIQVLELNAPVCFVQGKCPTTSMNETGFLELGPQFKVT